jgi:hypothetical protein
MVEQRKRIRRGWDGRFLGFRINCEQVPMLPASIVQRFWDDPRRIPYLLIWKGRQDGEVKEAVRLARFVPQPDIGEADSLRIKRTDGSTVPVYLAWRRQHHGGQSLLFRCWRCQRLCRALYGAKVGNDGRFYKAVMADWECRKCAELRYSSEGGALLIGGGLLSRLLRQPFPDVSSPRPEAWLPYMFTSIDDPQLDEIVRRNRP